MVAARTESYAGDTQALVATRAGVTRVASVTDEFASLSGQTLHLAKSFAFTTVPGSRIDLALVASDLLRLPNLFCDR